MEKAFQKFLRRVLLKDYPMYEDVHVTKVNNPFRGANEYEVFLVILEDEWNKIRDTDTFIQIRNDIFNLAPYMQIPIGGVYNEVVDDEEWEEMKTNTEN